MTRPSDDLPQEAFQAYIDDLSHKSLLRLLTCGSVDDGKSTLIGRLLYDAHQVLEDQMVSLRQESAKYGTTEDDIDFALLVDGLEAEREQGITIDVAYRFFNTAKRKFIIADTPGHEQFTRNMATGASTADVAILLVDATKGILTQTRRHAFIVSLLGIRHVVLAVNKIDLVDYSEDKFQQIVADFTRVAENLTFTSVMPIPLSARFGDNVTAPSPNLAWYKSQPLLPYLEDIRVEHSRETAPFRMPIQYVNRPNADFRGFCGQIASGKIAVNDLVSIAKSGQTSTVKRIVTYDGDLDEAYCGQSITLVLKDEVDCSRGDLLSFPDERPSLADQMQATIVWFDENPLHPGRSYTLATETDRVAMTVTDLRYRYDVNHMTHEAATSLSMNDIGVCNLSTQQPLAFDAYKDNSVTGAFIIIDRMTNATAGAGMIDFPLRRADNIQWQALDINKQARQEQKHQKPLILWFTGFSASGKSTIANLVEKQLYLKGRHSYLLDGDNIRHGLNRDLGFTDEARIENIRRVGEVAKLMLDAGLIVLVSFISPFRAERNMVRQMVDEGEFIEVFVDTPLEECARRDPKGLYKKAQAGQIKNFTGIDSPYEPPQSPEIHLKTSGHQAEDLAQQVLDFLMKSNRS